MITFMATNASAPADDKTTFLTAFFHVGDSDKIRTELVFLAWAAVDI
jgi:hypothetical protein